MSETTKKKTSKKPTKTTKALEITKADFEELIRNFADQEEILNYYNGNKEALKSFCMENYKLNFRQTYNKLLAKAKIDLRKRLLNIAEGKEQATKNQLTAIVWLSKAYLKLRENTPVSFNQTTEGSNSDFIQIPKKTDYLGNEEEDKEEDY